MIADLRYALRMLIKAPAFTFVAILTLALGIGANSAIFSVIDPMLLRSLPFPDANRIVMIWAQTGGGLFGDRDVFSYPDYVDLRDQNRSFAKMAAFTRAATVLNKAEESQALEGVAIGPQIFDVLGVKPLLGRGYTSEEDQEGAAPVVVLTYPFWQRAFGGDPNIVGQQISLAARNYTVLGVMPVGWKFPVEDEHIDYAIPLHSLMGASAQNRNATFLSLVGRLQPGVSTRQAKAELDAISGRLARQYPDSNTGRETVSVATLHDDVVGNVRPALLVLSGAVVLVLLIACANVANLLLARAAARSREIAIRTALGASRAVIVRQLLAESLLLALVGGAAGLLLAWWGVDVLGTLALQALPHLGTIRVNPSVCVFTFALATASTLLFGLLPALQVSRPNVIETLQQGAKGSTGGLQSQRLRALLVISQVALSLLLLSGAGLLIKSFFNLRATNPGFVPDRLMTAQITLPRALYGQDDGKQIRTFQAIEAKLAAIPGLQFVGGVDPLPLGGNTRFSSFTIGGAAPLPRGQHPSGTRLVVTPNYFYTMKIPLLRGRVFTPNDNANSKLVVMINEAFARHFFPQRDPVGRQLLLDRPDGQARAVEIIGVVGNSRHEALNTEPGPEFYSPLALYAGRSLDLVLRLATPHLGGLDAAVRNAVHEVDKDLFVPQLAPMSNFLATQLAQPRFNMLLLAIFAGLAVLLATIGIYGVIAYSVVQRTREIGIRMALGAQRRDMLAMVLRQSLSVVLIGVALGLLAAFAGTRLLASLLYGVGANDLLTYAIVVFLLGAAALLASYIPARRATKVDPMVALRYE
ncbi:MAG: ABC transporter permease [Chthoniobacterales bacterium]|nr:ABC transporter permease [Chthoniobacterales bacterium]